MVFVMGYFKKARALRESWHQARLHAKLTVAPPLGEWHGHYPIQVGREVKIPATTTTTSLISNPLYVFILIGTLFFYLTSISFLSFSTAEQTGSPTL